MRSVDFAARLLDMNSDWDMNSSQVVGSSLNLSVFPDL